MNKEIEKAKFNNRLLVKLFGKEIVLTVQFLWWACGLLWSLLIFIIIFSICYFLYDITQEILNASHGLLDAVSDGLTKVNDFSIPIGIPGLFHIDLRVFGGSLSPWIRDVDRSNNSFPRKAKDLIINIIVEMIETIIDTLPVILEGIANAFEEIADSI